MNKNFNYKKRQKQNTYDHYINFTRSEKDLKKKFKMFKKLNIGYYDLSLYNTKSYCHHYTFFGEKNLNFKISVIIAR